MTTQTIFARNPFSYCSKTVPKFLWNWRKNVKSCANIYSTKDTKLSLNLF